MQMTVVNQKTRSIQSASSEAWSGSHGMATAITAEPAPMSSPIATTRTIAPLRTEAESTLRRRIAFALAHAPIWVGPAPKRRFHGTWSKSVTSRGRGHLDLGRDRRVRRDRRRRDRVDPDDRRDRRPRAVDDLLVVVGRLRRTPTRLRRRGWTARRPSLLARGTSPGAA